MNSFTEQVEEIYSIVYTNAVLNSEIRDFLQGKSVPTKNSIIQ